MTGHQFYALASDVALWATSLMVALIVMLLGSPDRCMSLDANTLSHPAAVTLREAGWLGDPTDGEERVYSPACRAMIEERQP